MYEMHPALSFKTGCYNHHLDVELFRGRAEAKTAESTKAGLLGIESLAAECVCAAGLKQESVSVLTSLE
jgi:hypothetical protein